MLIFMQIYERLKMFLGLIFIHDPLMAIYETSICPIPFFTLTTFSLSSRKKFPLWRSLDLNMYVTTGYNVLKDLLK